jgi:hypothetical protein
MPQTYTCYIAGIPHAKPDLSLLAVGSLLTLVREPENPYDPNAIRVEFNGKKLGYIPKVMTAWVTTLSAKVVGLDPTNKWHEVTIEF